MSLVSYPYFTPPSTFFIDEQVIADARRICADKEYIPKDSVEFCSRILHTCFMGTEHSSADTRGRAKELANVIGSYDLCLVSLLTANRTSHSYHLDLNMDTVVTAVRTLFSVITNRVPRFTNRGAGPGEDTGGTWAENQALQNIQVCHPSLHCAMELMNCLKARLRMVLAYMFAQLLPWVRGGQGGLLVLGSANVDESLRGYLTKYDCSSGRFITFGFSYKPDLTFS